MPDPAGCLSCQRHQKAPAPRILSWGREPWLRGATPVHRRLAASASAGTNAESPARKSFPGTVTGAPAAAYWGRVFLPGTYIPASAAVTCRERDFMPILASFQGSASLSALRFLPGSTSLSALRFPSRTVHPCRMPHIKSRRLFGAVLQGLFSRSPVPALTIPGSL